MRDVPKNLVGIILVSCGDPGKVVIVNVAAPAPRAPQARQALEYLPL